MAVVEGEERIDERVAHAGVVVVARSHRLGDAFLDRQEHVDGVAHCLGLGDRQVRVVVRVGERSFADLLAIALPGLH